MNKLEKVKKLKSFLQYTPAVISLFFALSFWRKGFNETAVFLGLIGIGLILLSVLLNTIQKKVSDRGSIIAPAILVFCCSLYMWISREIYHGLILTFMAIFMIFGSFLHSQKKKGTRWSTPMWQIYIPLAVSLITLGPLLYLQYVSDNKKNTVRKAAGVHQQIAEKSPTPNTASKVNRSASLAPIEKMVDIMNQSLTPEQRDNPAFQKMMEIIASDSFQEQVEQQKPKSPHDFLQLFAEQGLTEASEIDFDKILTENQKRLEAAYKARNPGKAPQDEDDVMANRLVESIKQRGAAGGMTKFLTHPDNAAWIGFRFKDDPEAYNAWMDQVILRVEMGGSRAISESRERASQGFDPIGVEPTPLPQQEIPIDENASQDTLGELEDSIIPDTADRAKTPPVVDTEKVIPQVSPDPSALPTEEELETTLEERFSSERFERAMSTLERYGPEEGLRRLKESDPEIARQMERRRDRAESEETDR